MDTGLALGAQNETRTRTPRLRKRRILSPLCLPFHHPGLLPLSPNPAVGQGAAEIGRREGVTPEA